MNRYDSQHTCCFTGHRPEKLGIYEEVARAWLEKQIDLAIADGFTTFITGCARGADLWAGAIVLRKRQSCPGLRLVAASPWPDCCRAWPEAWKAEYLRVIRQADHVEYMGQRYFRGVYHIRNQWMVQCSGRVIGLFTGAPGGTKMTVGYARRLRRELVLYPDPAESNSLLFLEKESCMINRQSGGKAVIG